MLSALVSSLLQVLALTGVAFLAYLPVRRAAPGFRAWVGLTAPQGRTLLEGLGLGLVGALAMMLLFSLPGFRELAGGPNTVAGKLRAAGPSASTLVQLVLYAVVQTALAEEIFFRGFLAKRLIGWLGFPAGSIVQALLFGALHLLLFVGAGEGAFSPARAAGVAGVTTLLGWALAALNETRGNGSILPGWTAHAVVNLLTYAVLAFRPW